MGRIELIKKLEVGDTFYETDYGFTEEYQVLTKPVKEDSAWIWNAKSVKTDEVIEFMVNEEFMNYAPNIHLRRH